MKRMVIILISLALVSNAYAADKKSQPTGNNGSIIPSSAPDPDDLSKKAQQEAAQKTNYMNNKYKQHSKKENPNQTAAQTQAKHGGPTASNVTVPTQNNNYSAPAKTTKTKKNKN